MYEVEEQRLGRNKQTTINNPYIHSGSYRRKFDKISTSIQLNRLLYRLSKQMLTHRSGTLYEDMYWIDVRNMKVVAKETDSIKEKEIIYSSKTRDIISNNNSLITIHSHPNSYPPSISDINSNFINNYLLGIIVCHDGRIYLYNADEEISAKYYHLTVAEYIQNGYNEDEAQLCTLNEIKGKFNIQFREVKDDDS